MKKIRHLFLQYAAVLLIVFALFFVINYSIAGSVLTSNGPANTAKKYHHRR